MKNEGKKMKIFRKKIFLTFLRCHPKLECLNPKLFTTFATQRFIVQNIDRGYMLQLPWRGGSNRYPQSMF